MIHTIGSSPPEASLREIPRLMKECKEKLALTRELLSQLHDRLKPVLLNEPVEDKKGCGTEPSCTLVGREMVEMKTAIIMINDELSNLLAGIQV